jgi:sugar phosphate isomerase/epimerase
MRRRAFLAGAAAMAAQANAPRSKMGLVTNSFMTVRRPRDPHAFLEDAAALGAAGIQAPPPAPGTAAKLRERVERLGMYYEAMIPLAGDDTEAFEKILVTCKEAGADTVRAGCLSGRRYETFRSLDDWKRFVAESRTKLRRTIPLCAKHRVRLALENHKDWTVEELLSLLKEFEDPWFGVTLDTGNNVALLDDADAVCEALAPYTFSTHLKDMGVQPYEDGFLLSEVPFGEGYVNVKRAIELIRKHQPKTRFNLEMITRDPLKIPCLTDQYWATMPGRPGSLLAHTLRVAQQKQPRQGLPYITPLPKPAQARWEEDNVKQCLTYARNHYGL